jgi:CBS domain-containing protein
MQLAKNIMVKKVVTISKNKPVIDAVSTIAKHSISCIVVTAAKKPIGILTERDIVRDVLVAGLNPKKVTVNEVMNKDVPTVTANTSIIELVKFMKHRFLRRVPVVNNKGDLIGIITETDVVNAVIMLGRGLSQKMKHGSDFKRYVAMQKELYNSLRDIREIRNKISTGSKDLNNLLGGGLPIGSSTLICGEPGSGKTLLAYSFLYDGLLMNDCGIYIFSNELLDEVRGGFRSLGFNIEKYEKKHQIFFDDICASDPKKKAPDICGGFKD